MTSWMHDEAFWSRLDKEAHLQAFGFRKDSPHKIWRHGLAELDISFELVGQMTPDELHEHLCEVTGVDA